MSGLRAKIQNGEISTSDAAILEMAAFDELPSAIQTYVRSCEVELLATEVFDVFKANGRSIGLTIMDLKAYVSRLCRSSSANQKSRETAGRAGKAG